MSLPTNADRASWADDALHFFIDTCGMDHDEEQFEAIGDLLADLMHWCDVHGHDFDAAMIDARMHYDAETGGDDF